MTNRMFGKCIACFYGYTTRRPSKNRISRKQKKQLKRWMITPVCSMFYSHDDFCSCQIRTTYKDSKNHFNLFKPFYKELGLLDNLDEMDIAKIYINSKGRLCFHWESDDDYGGSSGVMPICYSEEEAGETWSYSELGDLFRYLYKDWNFQMPVSVVDDRSLLMYLKENPIPAEWKGDEDE